MFVNPVHYLPLFVHYLPPCPLFTTLSTIYYFLLIIYHFVIYLPPCPLFTTKLSSITTVSNIYNLLSIMYHFWLPVI